MSKEIENTFSKHFRTAYKLHHYGNYEGAIREYKIALTYDIKPEIVFNNMGKVYSDIGNEQAERNNKQAVIHYKKVAINYYSKALAKDHDYLPALNNIGAAYSALGDKNKAIDYYNKVLVINENYAPTLNNMGRTESSLHHKGLALYFYERAIQMNDKNPLYHYNKSMILTALHYKNETLDALSKALYNMLGNSTASAHLSQKAIAYIYKKAVPYQLATLNTQLVTSTTKIQELEDTLLVVRRGVDDRMPTLVHRSEVKYSLARDQVLYDKEMKVASMLLHKFKPVIQQVCGQEVSEHHDKITEQASHENLSTALIVSPTTTTWTTTNNTNNKNKEGSVSHPFAKNTHKTPIQLQNNQETKNIELQPNNTSVNKTSITYNTDGTLKTTSEISHSNTVILPTISSTNSVVLDGDTHSNTTSSEPTVTITVVSTNLTTDTTTAVSSAEASATTTSVTANSTATINESVGAITLTNNTVPDTTAATSAAHTSSSLPDTTDAPTSNTTNNDQTSSTTQASVVSDNSVSLINAEEATAKSAAHIPSRNILATNISAETTSTNTSVSTTTTSTPSTTVVPASSSTTSSVELQDTVTTSTAVDSTKPPLTDKTSTNTTKHHANKAKAKKQADCCIVLKADNFKYGNPLIDKSDLLATLHKEYGSKTTNKIINFSLQFLRNASDTEVLNEICSDIANFMPIVESILTGQIADVV